MRIQLLKNAFKPGESRTRTILKKGEVVTVTDEEGEILIEKGKAVNLEEPQKSDTPDNSWTVAEIEAYAQEHEIDLSDAKNKAEKLALVSPTE